MKITKLNLNQMFVSNLVIFIVKVNPDNADEGRIRHY